MARRRDTELFDLVEPDPTSPRVHWGDHVIAGEPDPDCAACDRRAVWSALMAQRGGAGHG